MSDSRDTIYANPLQTTGLFSFDANVADVFPDMIQRSVPGYANIVAMTGLLAQRFATPGSRLYDLGCSLGASTLSMRRNLDSENCRITGVDNSEAMLERCRQIIGTDTSAPPVDLVCADIVDVPIGNASVVVLNFTLQFVPREQRDALIRRIYAGLLPGGILILSEKVVFENPNLDALNIELHHEFKRANGYSDLEIAQKRAALENVLVPESLAGHKRRIANAGFHACDVWFQCFNFASMIALK